MSLSHLIFDLDDTLYPRHLGLMEEIARRIMLWMQKNMDLEAAEAVTLRQAYLHEYGTTLGGLIAEHDIDSDEYLEFVHDIPIDQYIQPNPALNRMLESIQLHKAIFTNATSEHAQRVLRALGVNGQFEWVIGIREIELYNKPHPEAYRRLLQLLSATATTCVLVDDRAVNLWPAQEMGMTTVIVDSELVDGIDLAVKDVLEVGPLLAQLMEASDGRDDT